MLALLSQVLGGPKKACTTAGSTKAFVPFDINNLGIILKNRHNVPAEYTVVIMNSGLRKPITGLRILTVSISFV